MTNQEHFSKDTAQELNSPIISRHKMRVRVMQALYAHIVGDTPAEVVFSYLLEELYEAAKVEAPHNAEFLKELFFGTIRNISQLRSIIEKHLVGWTWERLFMVDKCVLLCGTYEMLTFPDIPLRVTLNEWIEIAKTFGTARSAGFINGLLDAIRRSLSQDPNSSVAQKPL